jgi:F0F1-type ATP synthase assembly protein I
LDIFKPGFKAGPISIITLLYLGFAFNSVETKIAEFEYVYLFPIFFILIGYIIGMFNVVRIKMKENRSIFL